MELKNKLQHSDYYHKRFEGYMEKMVPKENGKGYRIERVYTAEFYHQKLSPQLRLAYRFLYALLYLISVVLFFLASTRPTNSNLAGYVSFSSCLSILALLGLFIVMLSYMTAQRYMTIWEHYAGPVRLKGVSLLTSGLLGIQGILVVLFILLNRDYNLGAELLDVAVYLTSSLTIFVINRIEKKISYEIIPNTNVPLRGGYYIDF